MSSSVPPRPPHGSHNSPEQPEHQDQPEHPQHPEPPPTARPAKVRITSPYTDAAQRIPSRSTMREIEQGSGLGEVYVHELVSAQRRLLAQVLLAMALFPGSVPLLLWALPGLRELHLAGFAATWIIVGGLTYPMIVGACVYFVRASERLEAQLGREVDERQPLEEGR